MVNELSGLLRRHFSRIRRMNDNTYRMKMGSQEILIELGGRIHTTRYIEPAAEGNKFTEKATKELDNARLMKIEQINNDRIISFEFDKGSLIFEMFGKGNAILVREGKVVAAHRYESWSDREIKAGAEYKPPKPPATELVPSKKYIIVSLTKMSIGKEYALEALAQAGIDEKTPGTDLTDGQLDKIKKALEKIRKDAKPYGFYKDGKMIDLSLAKLSKHELEIKEFGSLSEAADAYYANLEASNPKLEKLLKRLEQQKERLLKLKDEEKEYRSKGDLVYERYNEIEELIALAKKGDFKSLEKVNRKERSFKVDLSK